MCASELKNVLFEFVWPFLAFKQVKTVEKKVSHEKLREIDFESMRAF